MKASFFNHVRFPGDWEINLHLARWCFRLGRSQIALWRNYHEPVFCWLARDYRPIGLKGVGEA